MITDFNVERVAVAIDVAFVESVGTRELPIAEGIDALQHGVEGVMLMG
jgi:hypothetical protein